MKKFVLSILFMGVLFAGCGEHKGDPKEAYSELVKAAKAGDGGKMYDVLDTSFRKQFDTMLTQQAAHANEMPADERSKWDSLKGLHGRAAFSKMVALEKNMIAPFEGEMKILKVDTLYVLTVQHGDKPPELRYFRWENGGYKFTAPPSAPRSAMPKGHPNVNPGQPMPQPQPAPRPGPAPQRQPGTVKH